MKLRWSEHPVISTAAVHGTDMRLVAVRGNPAIPAFAWSWAVQRGRPDDFTKAESASGYAETLDDAKEAARQAASQILQAEQKGYPVGHLYIRFDDGRAFRVPAWEDPGALSVGQSWEAGWLVGPPPDRCYFREDYFSCAMGEGEIFEGRVVPAEADIDPSTGIADFEAFSWKLVKPGETFDLAQWPLAMPGTPEVDIPEDDGPSAPRFG